MKCILIIALCLYSVICQGGKLQGTTIASNSSSETCWSGLEFSTKVTITQITYTQKSRDKSDYILGVFEAANNRSFIDAIPIYMIIKEAESGQISSKITQGFKYIRYVSPKGKSIRVEFDVYGVEYTEEEGKEKNITGIYQPSKLPLVIVNTQNSEVPDDKETSVTANILIVKDGTVNAKGTGNIKIRGNSTLNPAKKSYRIKFDKKKRVLGLKAKAKKWVLFANNYDKSLLRNKLGYHMSNILGLKWAPQCQHVDMILNGDFIGNYLLCDQIEINENRLNITKMKQTDVQKPEVTGGYLLEIDGYALKESSYFKTNGGILFSIKYPGKNITTEQKTYIEKKINSVEKEIVNGNLKSIDIDSFLRYFILQDFTGSPDSLWSSLFLTKERGDEKIYFGPIWDLDLAFGNVPSYQNKAQKNFGYKGRMAIGGLTKIVNTILSKKLSELKYLWGNLTISDLTTDALIDYIDENVKLINDSQNLNFIRWEILNEKSFFQSFAKGTYEAEVNSLKQFIETRMEEFTEIIDEATEESINKESYSMWGGWGGQFGQTGGWGGYQDTWGNPDYQNYGWGGQFGWGGFGGYGNYYPYN